MNELPLDRDPLQPLLGSDNAPFPGLEEMILDYERERPDDHRVAAALRKMPQRWAAYLLSIRAHASQTQRWKNNPADPLKAHREGLFESPIDGVVADVNSEGKPRTCDQCSGTRFMRMTNHKLEPVEIQTDNRFVAHVYGPGESYLIPCDRCSKDRLRRYRERKPLRAKDDKFTKRKAEDFQED